MLTEDMPTGVRKVAIVVTSRTNLFVPASSTFMVFVMVNLGKEQFWQTISDNPMRLSSQLVVKYKKFA